MKLLHIAEFGIRKTGIGTVVERLFNEQRSSGHDVRIATTSPNLAYRTLELFDVSNPDSLSTLLSYWKPDVVVFHSIWCMPYIKMGRILKKHRIPYAIMMHGANSIENYKRNKMKKWVANSLFFNRFMREASCIIYLSKKEYENCVSKNINKKIAIIPNGCDLVDFDVDSKKPNWPFEFVYLGRLIIHHKGLDYLMDALDILKRIGFQDAVFRFYGNDNDVDIEIVKKRLLSLDGIASYEGAAYDEKKVQVLKNADAFILTSRYEGMPMGVLEALAYGVPCLLTPGTNMSEDVVASGAGWESELCAQSIADTILLASSTLKKEYIKYHKSAYFLSKSYDWREINNRFINLMQKISSNVNNQTVY